METTKIYMLYMHLYTSKTYKKDHSRSTLEKEAFGLKMHQKRISDCQNFKKSLERECPTPIAAHVLVHIKNIHKKESQYKHIRKGAFSSKNAPEIISDC